MVVMNSLSTGSLFECPPMFVLHPAFQFIVRLARKREAGKFILVCWPFPLDHKEKGYSCVPVSVVIGSSVFAFLRFSSWCIYPSSLQNSFSCQCYSKDLRKQYLSQMAVAGSFRYRGLQFRSFLLFQVFSYVL